MAVLGYLTKSKRDLGLAFGAHFQHDFSIKCSLLNALSMDKEFHVTPYFFLKTLKKMC